MAEEDEARMVFAAAAASSRANSRLDLDPLRPALDHELRALHRLIERRGAPDALRRGLRVLGEAVAGDILQRLRNQRRRGSDAWAPRPRCAHPSRCARTRWPRPARSAPRPPAPPSACLPPLQSRSALSLACSRDVIPPPIRGSSPLGEKVPEGREWGPSEVVQGAPHQFGRMTHARAIVGGEACMRGGRGRKSWPHVLSPRGEGRIWGGAMDLGIKGLRVLVTAGASGIGLEISRAFVREGAKVHICDVDQAALAAAAKSDPALTQSVCDVSDRAQVGKLFDDALKTSAASTAWSTTPASPDRPARSRRSTRRTGTAALPSTSPASSTACASPCRTSSSPRTPAS